MELTEVVNAHFAVPVVGVILCALLVFAFGFKSSVQPPSFDFDQDDRKSNIKKRKPKKSPQGNGHISPSLDVAEKIKSAAISRQGDQNKSQSKSSPKSQQQQKLRKTENKASKHFRNNDVKEEVAADNDGEWTTQLSRRVKKQKQKQDESKGESPTPVEDKSSNLEPSTPENKKTSKNKKEINPEDSGKVEKKEVEKIKNDVIESKKISEEKKIENEKVEKVKETKIVAKPAKNDVKEVEEVPKEKRSPKKKTPKKDSEENPPGNIEAANLNYADKVKPDSKVPTKPTDSEIQTKPSDSEIQTKPSDSKSQGKLTEANIETKLSDSKIQKPGDSKIQSKASESKVQSKSSDSKVQSKSSDSKIQSKPGDSKIQTKPSDSKIQPKSGVLKTQNKPVDSDNITTKVELQIPKLAESSKKSERNTPDKTESEDIHTHDEKIEDGSKKKKKIKTKSQPKSPSSEESGPQNSPTAHLSNKLSSDVPSLPETIIKETSQKINSNAAIKKQVVQKENRNDNQVKSSEDTSPAAGSTAIVSSEELSDQWLEAKTQRKKKARRDT